MTQGARITMRVLKDINPKALDELKRRLNGNRVVHVGVPAGKTEKDGTPLAMIAAVHEFGAGDVPERPFLRVTPVKHRMKYIRLNRINLVKMLRGQMTAETALGQLGEMCKGDVQAEIRHGNFKPLAPKTIRARERKRSGDYNDELSRKVEKKRAAGNAAGPIDRPLIDSGQLVQSITWEIAK